MKTYSTKASLSSFVLAQIRKPGRKGRLVFLFHGWGNEGKQRKKRPRNFLINDFTQDWLCLSSAGRALWVSWTHFQGLSRNFKHTSNSAHQSRFWPQTARQPGGIPLPTPKAGCSAPAFDSTAIIRAGNQRVPGSGSGPGSRCCKSSSVSKTNEIPTGKSKTPSLHISWTTRLYFLTAATFQLSLPREVQHAPSKHEYSVTSDNSSFRQTLLLGRLQQEKVL